MRLKDCDASLRQVQCDVRSQRPAPPSPKIQTVQENAAAKEKHVKLMTKTWLEDYHFSRVKLFVWKTWGLNLRER